MYEQAVQLFSLTIHAKKPLMKMNIFRSTWIKKTLMILLLTGAAFVAVTGVIILNFGVFLLSPGSASREVRRIEIQPGMGGSRIWELLHHRGVVSSTWKFALLTHLRGSSQRLQAGEYDFMPLSTPGEVLDQIVAGKVVVRCAVFPEGSTIRDVARILEAQQIVTAREVLDLCGDSNFINELGIGAPGLEGYLFPETYCFTRKQNGPAVLRTMVRQFARRLPQGWETRVEKLGFSIHQIIILASIVEKETGVDSERPLIAGVFLNRLRSNMPLQSDPTAVYDLLDFAGPVTPAHLKRQSPYNTYVVKGLPSGPICNPGAESIRAALYPAEVPYFYFVSNQDGTHSFSKSFSEHQQAIRRLRNSRAEKNSGAPLHETPPDETLDKEATGDF
jgi:UPF0755 protein